MSEQSESKAAITASTRKRWFREARVVRKTLTVSGFFRIGGATIRRDAHDGTLRVEFEQSKGLIWSGRWNRSPLRSQCENRCLTEAAVLFILE